MNTEHIRIIRDAAQRIINSSDVSKRKLVRWNIVNDLGTHIKNVQNDPRHLADWQGLVIFRAELMLSNKAAHHAAVMLEPHIRKATKFGNVPDAQKLYLDALIQSNRKQDAIAHLEWMMQEGGPMGRSQYMRRKYTALTRPTPETSSPVRESSLWKSALRPSAHPS